MTLTEKQQKGLDIAIQRYRTGEKYTVISGYAGSGKSTLVKFIIAALAQEGIDPERDVCFAAFTGKATQVLQKKGNKNISTLHKLLYVSKPTPDGRFIRFPKPTIGYKIVIVDEVSMAPKSLMSLLLTHDTHIICLGDPFQLPPVSKDEDNHLLENPHIFLDEIMRQAQESEIIKLSMDVREQKTLSYFQGEEVKILPKEQLSTGMLQWADQILVGTNNTRIAINNQMRQLLGRGDRPEDGDKVICLRNYWDDMAENGDALVNGTIGFLSDSFESYIQLPKYLFEKQRINVLHSNFITDTGAKFNMLQMDTQMILTGNKSIDYKTAYRINQNKKYRGVLPKEFTYGYAITTHRAQGSEWNNVLIIEEKFPFDKTEHARWLYTAITRSSNKLVLVR